MATSEDLQERWRHIYQNHLPKLAKAKDPVQKIWPVHLDHCFARIVLDNAIGKDKPWTDVLKQPAIRNMDTEQITDAIELAEQIATGEANLSELDNRSLQLRGKSKKRSATAEEAPPTRKKTKMRPVSNETLSKYFVPSLKKETDDIEKPSAREAEDLSSEIERIRSSSLTPFRKHILMLLCEIPRGRYSTYGALSDHISETSHKTCARAVGSGIRNNPFAPEVPCHRILAADGSIGGYIGEWGKDGKYANKKHQFLAEEGVRFDSTGKAKGPPFRDFTAVLAP